MLKKTIIIISTLLTYINPLSAVIPENSEIQSKNKCPIFQIESYPVAIPLKGGPLRVLFIGHKKTVGRVSIEISARLDCQREILLTHSRTSLNKESSETDDVSSVLGDYRILKRLIELLNENWDVIWLDFKLEQLTMELRKTLMNRISEGTGLVYINGGKTLKNYTTRGKVDKRQLNAVMFENIKPKCPGRRNNGILVSFPPLVSVRNERDLGDYYNSAANTLLFASGRVTGTIVTDVGSLRKKVECEAMGLMKFTIKLFHLGEMKPMKIYQYYRNEKDIVVFKTVDTFNIKSQQSFIRLNYPVLPSGKYSADIIISDSDGVVAIAGTSFKVTALEYITGIDLWEISVPRDGVISGLVKISSKFKEGMALRVRLFDSWGRLIDIVEPEISLNRISADFAFLFKRTTDHILTVRVDFYKSNNLVHYYETQVFVKNPHDFKKFNFVVGDEGISDVAMNKDFEQLRKTGVTTFILNIPDIYDPDQIIRKALAASQHRALIIPQIVYSVEKNDILSGKAKHDDVPFEKKINLFANTLRHFSPLEYSITNTLPSKPLTANRGFSEAVVVSFQDFMKKKYNTVGNMNDAWGRRFVSFDEVRPVTFDEAKKSGIFTGWLDTQKFENDLYTAVFSKIHKMITSSDSTAKVVFSGLRSGSNSDYKDNFHALTNLSPNIFTDLFTESLQICSSDFPEGLRAPWQHDALTGFIIGENINFRDNEPLLRALPWQSLFSGMNTIWWEKALDSEEAALTPYSEPSKAFAAVAEETADITGGIDKLLAGSSRHVDAIGILYSPASISAAFTTDETKFDNETESDNKPNNNKIMASPEQRTGVEHAPEVFNNCLGSIRGFYHACRDAGYTPGYWSEDDLIKKLYKNKVISVLFLPYAQAFSDEMAECIKEYVYEGGIVIADMRPAVMNEKLAMRNNGALDEMFGIVQGINRTPVIVSDTIIVGEGMNGVLEGLSISDCLVDSTVRARDGARVMASAGEIPAVIINKFGKGMTIFLNMNMGQYEMMRLQGVEAGLLEIIEWCLQSSNLEMPLISIHDAEGNRARMVQFDVFRDGGNEYVGILMDPASKKAGMKIGGNYSVKILGGDIPPSIYDMRSKKFLGITTQLQINLSPGKAQLFALLPYRVRSLNLELKSSIVKVGEKVEYTVSVTPHDNETKASRHVIRVSVTGPDGKERSYFADTFEILNGSGESSFYIELNAPHGRWSIKVQDVVTGRKSERGFLVLSP